MPLVKQASPVDTGRFRASWQVGENCSTRRRLSTGHLSRSPTAKIERLGSRSTKKLGNVYSVHNNLPYAEPLANGSSKQTVVPRWQAGWVQGVAKDVQAVVLIQRRTHREGVMSSTYNDVRAAIEGRIATELALAPAYPVSYQNVPFTHPTTRHGCRCSSALATTTMPR
jgi:hypothetical protein